MTACLLDRLYAHVQKIILARQNPVTGLLPASTAVTVHGNYTHAWVRDNVYSALAPWALAQAYRRAGGNPARLRILDGAVVKIMRGLMQAMMRQSANVERFKHSQDPLDALHAIYSAATGTSVAADDGWGHLQIDATSVFLLVLAQMTRAGLPIVQSLDEAAFIQNLVHYIAPAHRIADYGIWERGRKTNDGKAELNASSVGMAKAAMEAMQGLDLFGAPEEGLATIHVVPDDIAQARATLEALLPRESGSKEVDAALLSVIGYPAFAVDDPALVARTAATIREKLEGRYGCKRFLRDGHQTALEDHGRLHYEAGELSRFDRIESEWPLFFTYSYLTALVTGDAATAERYRAKLEPLLVERDGDRLLPELYIVPADRIAAERAAPGSQDRVPNENVPLLWAQSLYVTGLLIEAGLLTADDIDPLGRRNAVAGRRPVPVKLLVLSENAETQAALAAVGVEAESFADLDSVRICHADSLVQTLTRAGECPALALSGRPARGIGSLTTAQLFQGDDGPTLFVPPFIDRDVFYFSVDLQMLHEELVSEVAYLNRGWSWSEAPVLVFPVTQAMTSSAGFEMLARRLADLTAGRVPDLAVAGAPLADCLAGARRVTLRGLPLGQPLRFRQRMGALPAGVRVDGAPPTQLELARHAASATEELLDQLSREDRLSHRLELLALLRERMGPDFLGSDGVPSRDRVESLYLLAGRHGQWTSVRRAAFLLERHDDRVQDAFKEMIVRQKRVLLGSGARVEAVVDRPLDSAAIMRRLRAGASDALSAMLAEELLLFCGHLVKARPDLFRHCMTIRPLDLMQLLKRFYSEESWVSGPVEVERLGSEPPHAILDRLRALIAGCPGMTGEFCLPVLTALSGTHAVFAFETGDGPWLATSLAADRTWYAWRKVSGTLLPLPPDFHARVWELLRHCDTLVIADPMEPTHHLDSETLRSDTTPQEQDFARQVEARLDRIGSPEYRQLTVETLWALSAAVRVRPDIFVRGALAIDEILAVAVDRHRTATDAEPFGDPISDEAAAWRAFQTQSPIAVAEAVTAIVLERYGQPETVAVAA